MKTKIVFWLCFLSILISMTGCTHSSEIENSKELNNNDLVPEETNENIQQDLDVSIIKEMTQGHPDAVITVGTLNDGTLEYKVYGEDAKLLPTKLHTYAIGSITKTFTGALIAREVSDGKISIDEDICNYIGVTQKGVSLKELMTHTSGLSTQWELALMMNDSVTFQREDMIRVFDAQTLSNDYYEANYSNFGAAMAGTVVAAMDNKSYEELMNEFLQNDLNLKNTKVGGKGDLDHYRNWTYDEMAAAGGILSDVSDLLEYGKMQILEQPTYLSLCHEPQANFSKDYDCGYFWIIDKENDIIWHNGELSMLDENGQQVGFQSFLGFSKERNKVVVILSNIISYNADETAYTDLLGYQLMVE